MPNATRIYQTVLAIAVENKTILEQPILTQRGLVMKLESESQRWFVANKLIEIQPEA